MKLSGLSLLYFSVGSLKRLCGHVSPGASVGIVERIISGSSPSRKERHRKLYAKSMPLWRANFKAFN
jgi:hypothetical protein